MTITSWIARRLLNAAEECGRAFLHLRRRQIRSVHDALLDVYRPCRNGEPPQALRDELEQACQRMWAGVEKTAKVQWALFLFTDLRRLRSRILWRLYNRFVARIRTESPSILAVARGELSAFLREQTGARSFADLNTSSRERLLNLLLQSRLGLYRRLAISMRIFYTRGLYQGRIGRVITGIGDAGAGLMDASPVPALKFATPLRYRKDTASIDGDLDYIIVGSGPGGAVVGHQLQQAGKRVLMLEAGPFFLPGTYDGRAGLDFYEDGGYRTTTDGGIFVLNGRVVGGGSTINVDMAFPPAMGPIRYRIESWRASGRLPHDLWTPEEIDDAQRWVARRMGTRQVQEWEINDHNRILFRGARSHGKHPSLYQLNTFAPGDSPIPKTDKRDAVNSLLTEAMTASSHSLTLIPNAQATRVLIRNGRAQGVEFKIQRPKARCGLIPDPFDIGIPDGTTVKAYASQVILAGGALGSPALLLNSGVSNPNIGAGFVMHPFMLVLGQFESRVDCHIGTQSSVYVSDYLTTDPDHPKPDFLVECASARPEIGALMLPGNASDVYNLISQYRHIAGIGILLLDSVDANNRVVVNACGQPEIVYQLSEADKQRFRYGVAEGVRIMFKAGARKVILPTHENVLALETAGHPAILTDVSQADLVERDLHFHANQTPLFAAHMMASNKLGTDPGSSVVSPDYQVWGVDGLYVVDGSIFPGSVGANPMQCIYTIAKIFSQRHLGRARRTLSDTVEQAVS